MSVILDMAGDPILDMGGDPVLDMAGADAVIASTMLGFEAAAVGNVPVTGSIAASIPAFAASAVAGNLSIASISVSMPAFEGAASGTLGAAPGPVSGTTAATVPSMQAGAVGSTVEVNATPDFRVYPVGTDTRDFYRMPIKDPSDRLDYAVDFSAVLLSGETINSVSATFSDVTESTPAPAIRDTSVAFWVSGGTAETEATVTVQITTSQSRIYERTALIPIAEL